MREYVDEAESGRIADRPEFRKTVDQKWLRRMYRNTRDSDHSHRRFVRREFDKEFSRIIRRCPKVVPPPVEKFEEEMSDLLDDLEEAMLSPEPMTDKLEIGGASCKISMRN